MFTKKTKSEKVRPARFLKARKILKNIRCNFFSKIFPRLIIINALMILTIIISLMHNTAKTDKKTITENKGVAITNIATEKLEKGTPNYTVMTPNGIKKTWTKISPQGTDDVYTFTDKIGNATISISEQVLPVDFLENPAQKIEELAKDFKADEKVEFEDTIFYIGTSVKGAQSVILTKNGILILIKSTSIINKNDWILYVGNLK